MADWDIKRIHPTLYAPKTREFTVVDVPVLNYIMIDGQGDPNTSPEYATAVKTLYALSYAARVICKGELDRVNVVGPLEGLWTADDLNDYAAGNRAAWRWTMMIAQPDWVSPEIFAKARILATSKDGTDPGLARLEHYAEGRSVQFLHIGPYRDEGPTIAQMHQSFIPAHGFTPTGRHHEIYLSDPRKTVEEKLRTVVRQPVGPTI